MGFWYRSNKQSVSEIVSPINAVIADLDKYERMKIEEVETMEAESFLLQSEASQAHYEAHRASVLSRALKELLNSDD